MEKERFPNAATDRGQTQNPKQYGRNKGNKKKTSETAWRGAFAPRGRAHRSPPNFLSTPR